MSLASLKDSLPSPVILDGIFCLLRIISSCNCNAVGVQKARKTAGRFNLPIIGVHHMEAHTPVAR